MTLSMLTYVLPVLGRSDIFSNPWFLLLDGCLAGNHLRHGWRDYH